MKDLKNKWKKSQKRFVTLEYLSKKIYDQQEDMERPPRLSDIHIDIENMKMRMISNEIRRNPDMTVIEVDLINVEDEGVNDAIYFLRSFFGRYV